MKKYKGLRTKKEKAEKSQNKKKKRKMENPHKIKITRVILALTKKKLASWTTLQNTTSLESSHRLL
jgi:hypothetical protein